MCYTKDVMTVCIAALYENGKGAVLCSDQMATIGYPLNYEYENADVAKIVELNNQPKTFALVSGNVVFADEIISSVKDALSKKSGSSVMDIVNIFREQYQLTRRMRVIRNELEPRGLDLATYYKMHQTMLAPIVKTIDDALAKWPLNTEFIIAGKDGNLCHMYAIIHPGDVLSLDSIGYTAIGSGSIHAMFSIIESKYTNSMLQKDVEDLVKKAKERSEVAPGVGPKTNFEIL
jgi:hypothetical protein